MPPAPSKHHPPPSTQPASSPRKRRARREVAARDNLLRCPFRSSGWTLNEWVGVRAMLRRSCCWTSHCCYCSMLLRSAWAACGVCAAPRKALRCSGNIPFAHKLVESSSAGAVCDVVFVGCEREWGGGGELAYCCVFRHSVLLECLLAARPLGSWMIFRQKTASCVCGCVCVCLLCGCRLWRSVCVCVCKSPDSHLPN